MKNLYKRSRGRALPTVSVLMFFFSFTAFGQSPRSLSDMDIEDIMKLNVQSVFGASKFLQNVTDAPAAVSVVTHLDIEIYGYRSLADILRSVQGFNVTSDRNYSYVNVRGFQRQGDYNTRVLVLVDGHRTNDNIYDMALYGTEFPVDVELIERVELIRGPSSSIYGTNAFLGVINIVTRKGENTRSVQVYGDAGTLHTGKTGAAFGRTFANGVDLLLSSSVYQSRGQSRLYFSEFDSPATNNGIAENLDNDAYHRLFGALSFKGFTFQGVYGSRTKHVPTASFDTQFNDPNLKTIDVRGWADLRYSREVAGFRFTGRAYYDVSNYDGFYPENRSETDEPRIVIWRDYGRGKWWGSELDVEKTLFQNHKITAGAEYRDNFRVGQGAFDVEPYALDYTDERNFHTSAIFGEDQYAIHPKLLLNAGIRHDYYPGFGGTTNPRTGVIYKPAGKTAIKALWGTAFRAPNAYELFYNPRPFKPNGELRPEIVRTGELVFEKYFADRYHLLTSVYMSDIDDLISAFTNPAGEIEYQNDGSASSRGVEAEIEGKWSSGIAAKVGYSNQYVTEAFTGVPLPNSARHVATGNFAVPLATRSLFLATNVQYVSSIETLNGSRTKPFVVPNVTLTSRASRDGLSFSAGLYNIFNNHYGYPGSEEHRQNIIYQDGRTFRVGMKYSWRLGEN